MKKQFRIKKTEEFAEIMKEKKFYSSPAFVIYVKPKKESYARIGISVGKKIGNAVTRNKVKRQVRMMLQELFDFNGDFDMILLVRVKYHNENYNKNKIILENLFKKVKIYK